MDALPIKINLGIEKLVETISNATGLTARGIRKNADAESYAAIKKAKTETEVELLKLQGEEKIAQYVLERNKQKVENVEEIVSKAKQQFAPNEKVSEEPVEKDWMNRFLNIAEEISDEEMQDLWGRVLAGEIKKPQSYSLRTLEVLRNISKSEAKLIIKVSNYINGSDYVCAEEDCLNIIDQATLGEIGVLCSDLIIRTYTIPENGVLSYALNKSIKINIYASPHKKIELTAKKLTQAGREIMNLIEEHNYNVFLDFLSKKLKSKGATKVTVNDIVKWDDEKYSFIKTEREV